MTTFLCVQNSHYITDIMCVRACVHHEHIGRWSGEGYVCVCISEHETPRGYGFRRVNYEHADYNTTGTP